MLPDKKGLTVFLMMIVLFSIFLMAGCDFFDGPIDDPVEGTGSLVIKVDIPAVLQGEEVAVQSILEKIILDEVVFTVSKGSESDTQTISIGEPEDGIVVAFDELSIGTWDIQVVARDDDGYDIAEGTNVGTVRSGETTEVDATLDVLSGYLTLQVLIPDNDTIKSGKVILLGLIGGIGNIEETFEATAGDTVRIDIGEVEARIWPVISELYNVDGETIYYGEAPISVLPGRTTTAEIDFFNKIAGTLNITIYWNLPPDRPEDVTAVYDEGIASISWGVVAGAAGYMVFRSVEKDGEGLFLTHELIEGTSIEDDYAFKSTTYWYRVVAYDAYGLSSNFSEAISVEVPYIVGDMEFFMQLAPASTFPTGTDDSGSATVDHDFWVAENQVTYELWYEVRTWAEARGYTIANAGLEGGHLGAGNIGGEPTERKNEPVTRVNWYDCIVWCNALSEYLGYDPVYTIGGDVLRDSKELADEGSHEDVEVGDTNGFRLPTSMEWELAARYKGSDSSHGAIEYPAESGMYWTPGNYASGATADYNNAAATQDVAWYRVNSSDRTKDVGLKRENGLGVYDMSGNVWERCFTLTESGRVLRGGGWSRNADDLQVGRVFSGPLGVSNDVGFRIVRTHF